MLNCDIYVMLALRDREIGVPDTKKIKTTKFSCTKIILLMEMTYKYWDLLETSKKLHNKHPETKLVGYPRSTVLTGLRHRDRYMKNHFFLM